VDQQTFVIRIVTVVLALVLLAVIVALLYGLFDQRVDNKEIFTILGPSFQTIVGVFVGILGGRALEKK
jgi:hypothetical protein